jgi:hypothetical protein
MKKPCRQIQGLLYSFHMKNELKTTENISAAHQQEYALVHKDLIKVLILNLVYLAVILTLYFTNKNTHYLENWFNKLIHF